MWRIERTDPGEDPAGHFARPHMLGGRTIAFDRAQALCWRKVPRTGFAALVMRGGLCGRAAGCC